MKKDIIFTVKADLNSGELSSVVTSKEFLQSSALMKADIYKDLIEKFVKRYEQSLKEWRKELKS